MILIPRLAPSMLKATLIATLAGTASLCMAQAASSTSSPAKQALVQKAIQLQQAGIEGIGNTVANQTAGQVMQATGQAMSRVPVDKREALGAELQAEVRKFYEDIASVLRASALKAAPSTLGTALDEKLTEEEIKVLIAWLESPVNRKYQQVVTEGQQALGQKMVADTRPQIEPKLKALEQTLTAKLNAAIPAAASAPKAAATAPKK